MSDLPATPPVPRSIDEVTREWLTAALRSTGAISPDAAISSVRHELIEARSGVNGDAYRVSLAADGDVPSTLVAKLPAAPDHGTRGVAVYQRWYEREVRFYLELAEETPLQSPHCLFAAIEPNDDYILLLEDLGALRQGDQVAGCGLEDALGAIEGVAALHARWWGDASLEGHPWLPFTTVGLDRAGPVQGAFAGAWQRIRNSVAEAVRPIIDGAVERYPDLLAEISRAPFTLCHGDYRLDNLFFDDTARDMDVAAFDWQFVCRARGAYDLAYFVGLDLEPEVRRQHEATLIERYVEVLGSHGVQGYGLDECRRDYGVSLLLSFAVFAIGAAGPQRDERMRNVHALGIDRLAAAIRDASAAGWLQP